MSPHCASCRSEIRFTEVRGIRKGKTGTSGERTRTSTYPIGTISWCPIHGAAFPIA